MAFNVKLWGIRGSLPTPHTPAEIEDKIRGALTSFCHSGYNSTEQISQFMEDYPKHLMGGFGGHTSCVEVYDDKTSIIIDGGSGLRKKALELLKGPCGRGQGNIHLFMTHFHWDHLIGLPFFVPLFIPGNQIHIHAVQPELEEVFTSLFKKPFFPVPYSELSADVHFHQLTPRTAVKIDDFEVTPFQLDHPDPCWGFKFTKDNKSYSHCVDNEFVRATPEELGEDFPLYTNTDVMLFDAQYTVKETTEKVNWGHGAANFGIDLALREKIKHILFVHHDPSSSDQKIYQIEQEVQTYFENLRAQMIKAGAAPFDLKWSFAKEDQVIEVE